MYYVTDLGPCGLIKKWSAIVLLVILFRRPSFTFDLLSVVLFLAGSHPRVRLVIYWMIGQQLLWELSDCRTKLSNQTVRLSDQTVKPNCQTVGPNCQTKLSDCTNVELNCRTIGQNCRTKLSNQTGELNYRTVVLNCLTKLSHRVMPAVVLYATQICFVVSNNANHTGDVFVLECKTSVHAQRRIEVHFVFLAFFEFFKYWHVEWI